MWLLLVLLSVTSGAVCSKSEIIECFLTKVDTNNDTMISEDEINQFIIYDPHNFGLSFSGEYAMELCDTNEDNMLSEEDYDSPLSCININAISIAACTFCMHVN